MSSLWRYNSAFELFLRFGDISPLWSYFENGRTWRWNKMNVIANSRQFMWLPPCVSPELGYESEFCASNDLSLAHGDILY